MLPAPDKLQKIAMSLMLVLVAISFTFTNMYALLWTSSEWLVSTVLPAVIVQLTNQERGEDTLQPLRHNSVLDAAATMKAKHMAENEYFAHFSPDNVSPWHWFREAGYQYVHAGENLAIHFSDSDEVVQAWMESPTHRDNIMNGQFMEIGVGTARGTYQGFPTTYVVQLFGTPRALPERTFPATVEAASEVTTPATASGTVLTNTELAVSADAEIEAEPTRPAPVSVLSETDGNASNTDSSEPAAEETIANNEDAEDEAATAATSADTSDATSTDSELAVATTPATTSSTSVMALDKSSSTPSTTLTMTEAEAGEVIFMSSTLTTTAAGTPAKVQFVHNNEPPLGWRLATQPGEILKYTYVALAIVVVFLLGLALVREARQHRPYRMAYSVALLLLMVGLWTVQSWLVSGALIV